MLPDWTATIKGHAPVNVYPMTVIIKAIARAVDIPIFLYDVPSRTTISISPETVAQLAKIPNIIGIKEASGDLKNTAEIIRSCPEEFIVLSGDNFTTLPTIAIGGKGVISVTSNIVPGRMRNLVEKALAGDFEVAREEHYKLFGLMKAMFCYPSPAPAKKALELMRVIGVSELRLPMTEMSDTTLEQLIAEMSNFGLT